MLKQKLARGHLAIYARVATWGRMKAFQLTLSKIRHSWSMANKLTRQALSQDPAQTLGATLSRASVHHMAWQALVVRFHFGDHSLFLIT